LLAIAATAVDNPGCSSVSVHRLARGIRNINRSRSQPVFSFDSRTRGGLFMQDTMGGIFIRLLIGVLLAAILEMLNGVFTFLLPPFIVITPICLVIALIWAASSGGMWKRS
jgi:hypothetical protein